MKLNTITQKRSVAMKLTYAILRDERYNYKFGTAQSLAWKVLNLIMKMKKGVVEFFFLKGKNQDEVRESVGTLSSKFFNYDFKGNSNQSLKSISFFDMQKQAWRSFSPASLIAN